MIKLELEINEVNTILAVLGKHPFSEVVELISKIKQQGDPQAQVIAADAAATAVTDVEVKNPPTE
jgi:hypothetical protein